MPKTKSKTTRKGINKSEWPLRLQTFSVYFAANKTKHYYTKSKYGGRVLCKVTIYYHYVLAAAARTQNKPFLHCTRDPTKSKYKHKTTVSRVYCFTPPPLFFGRLMLRCRFSIFIYNFFLIFLFFIFLYLVCCLVYQYFPLFTLCFALQSQECLFVYN